MRILSQRGLPLRKIFLVNIPSNPGPKILETSENGRRRSLTNPNAIRMCILLLCFVGIKLFQDLTYKVGIVTETETNVCLHERARSLLVGTLWYRRVMLP